MSDTKSTILNRMLTDIDDSYDKSNGSFAYDILAAVSGEFSLAYADNEAQRRKKHIDSATGKELEKLVKEYANMDRKHYTYASGKAKITGDVGASFKLDDLVSNGKVTYRCTETISADENGIILADVECTSPGEVGNCEANTIIYFPKTLNGLHSVINIEAFTNGYDEETDEDLRKRYYDNIGNPKTSANIAMYEDWAREVTGVGDAKGIECWDGPGTIKVVIIDSNRKPADSDLIQSVTDYIVSVRPACSGELTVVSAESVTINISCIISINSENNTLEKVIENIKESIESYFDEISFKGTNVSYIKIGSKIINSDGVISCDDLLINGGTSNISIESTQIPILGELTVG